MLVSGTTRSKESRQVMTSEQTVGVCEVVLQQVQKYDSPSLLVDYWEFNCWTYIVRNIECWRRKNLG